SNETTPFSRRGALTGIRNRLAPYAPVPRVYGHMRLHPPMAAKPFTEVIENVQYLHLLFNLGPGPLQLSNPKIGETLIGSFDSNNKFSPNGNYEEVEIDVAENPRWYTNDVNQEAVNYTLADSGDKTVRTTAVCDEATIGITFPRGLFSLANKTEVSFSDPFNPTIDVKKGDLFRHGIFVTIEYRKVGQTTWHSANGYKTATECYHVPDDGSDGGGGGIGTRPEIMRKRK